MKAKEILILLLIVVAMSTRFVFLIDGESVLPNFTAVGAIAILGAVYLTGIKKWLFPLGVLWASDLILNNVIYHQYFDHFQVFGEIWVYISIGLIGLLAIRIMKKKTWTRLAITSILAGVLFYLITNFGVWLNSSSPYPKDINGLVQCYEAGIPFFRNTLISNLLFSFALFGIYETIAKKASGLKPELSLS